MKELPYHEQRDLCTFHTAGYPEVYANKHILWVLGKLVDTPSPIRRVLDIGCGDGYFVQALVNAGFDAYGVDIRDIYAVDDRSRFIQANATERIPLDDESFDLVWFYLFFEDLWYLQNVDEEKVSVAVKETHRLLRHDGFVFTRYEFPHEHVSGGFKLLTEEDAIDNVYQKLEVPEK